MERNISYGPYTVVPDDIDCNIYLELGSYTSIASGLTIVSGQHAPIANPKVVSTFPFNEWGFLDQYPASDPGTKVIIGSDVWIGQDVTILDGVEVGHGAVIAAGSLVVDNVYPYTMVAGNPATLKYYRYLHYQIDELLKIAWWNWPEEKIKQAVPYMLDIDEFLTWAKLQT